MAWTDNVPRERDTRLIRVLRKYPGVLLAVQVNSTIVDIFFFWLTSVRCCGCSLTVCGEHNRAGSGIDYNSPIWHRRPVKPAKHEQVKEGFPVMQSSMHWPPFRHGRRCGHTDAVERGQCNITGIFKEEVSKLPGAIEEPISQKQCLTRVIAAAHFHVCFVQTEDPSAWVAYVGGPLDVHHIGRARARDVEVALAVTGVETCLGRELARRPTP